MRATAWQFYLAIIPDTLRQQLVGIAAVLEFGVVLKMEDKKAHALLSSIPIHVCPTSDEYSPSEPPNAHQKNVAMCQAPMSPAMMPSCTALSINNTFSGATVLITGLSREPTGIPLSSTASVILHPNLSVEYAIDNGPAGVTGFVGSTVLEQLLRVCPAVSRIYLMVRSKRGMTGQIFSPTLSN